MRRWTRWAGPAGAFVFSVLVHANSLENGFAYDDEAIILANPAVLGRGESGPLPWYEAWRVPYWPETNVRLDTDVLYRPLAVQTYAWDMRLSGGAAVWFHLVNVILHACVSVGVWWLGRRLCGSDVAGLVAGWVFAVHPIHAEAVANVVGRAEVLAAGGVLLGVFSVDRLLLASAGVGRAAWAVSAVVAGAIAIFSKESGVAVIPTTAVYAWWRWRSAGRDRRYLLRVAPVLTAMLLVFALYLAARYDVCGGRLRVGGQLYGAGNILREADGVARVLTPVSLVGRYTALMLVPVRLLADYSYAVVLPTRSPADGYFLLGLATLAITVAAAVRSVRGGGAAFVASVGWVGSYVLVANAFILVAMMMAERWYYGPSMWMMVLAVMGGQWVLSARLDAARRGRWAAAVWPRVLLGLYLALLGGRTWLRNPAWRDTATLVERDTAAMSPGRRSAFFTLALARFRLDAGRAGEAEALARESLAIYPESAEGRMMLGRVLLATGRAPEAVKALEEAQRIAPHDPRVQPLLDQAMSAAAGIDVQARLRDAEAAVATAPGSAAAQYELGSLLEQAGQFERAATHYARAAELDAGHRPAWLGWGRTLAAAGRRAESAAVYERILERWPGREGWEAHANLALQLMHESSGSLYQPQRAIRHAEDAVRLGPPEMELQLTLNLAEVCAHCGRIDRAIELFEQVIRRLPPTDPQRRRLAERVEYWRGQR